MPAQAGASLFLDANVLICAAWKLNSETALIWQLHGVELITSIQVMAEVERNLAKIDQIERLRSLLTTVKIISFDDLQEPSEAQALPAKDRHVLSAAVASGAPYLITGDKKHFSQWFGKTICGVRIEPSSVLLTLFTLRQN